MLSVGFRALGSLGFRAQGLRGWGLGSGFGVWLSMTTWEVPWVVISEAGFDRVQGTGLITLLRPTHPKP